MNWDEVVETVEFEIKRQVKLSMVGGAGHLKIAASMAYILGAALEELAREEEKPCT